MFESTGTTTGELLFERPREKEFGFEKWSVGIVMSLVFLTFPEGGIEFATVSLALTVLVLMMFVRWVGINSPYKDETDYLARSDDLMRLALFVCGLHLVSVVLSTAPRIVGSMGAAYAFGSAMVGMTLLYIVLMEIVQGAYRLFWGYILYRTTASFAGVGENDGNSLVASVPDRLTRVFGRAAYIILKDSLPDRETSPINELRAFIDVGADELEPVSWSRLIALFGLVVIPFLVGISFVLAVIGGPYFEILAVVIGVYTFKHIFDATLLINGTMTVDRFLNPALSWPLQLLLYTNITYLVYLS